MAASWAAMICDASIPSVGSVGLMPFSPASDARAASTKLGMRARQSCTKRQADLLVPAVGPHSLPSRTCHQPQSDIVVWALHRAEAGSVRTKGTSFPGGPGGQPLLVQPTLFVVRPSVRDNSYLAAQSGLFTTINASGVYFMQNNGDRPSVEDFVARSVPVCKRR